MTEASEGKPAKPRKTGEAAWKEQKEAIAARNDAARKAGKAERQATERKAAERRRAVDLEERAALGG